MADEIMKNRVEYFEGLLKRCKEGLTMHPEMIPLTWVIDELEYLINLERGISHDNARLEKINIGWIAVREMDGYQDEDLIESLCLISQEVNSMRQERGLPNENDV